MKNTKNFFKLMIFAGIFIILGTAGASDLGRIALSEIFSQITLGFILIISGKTGLKILKAISVPKRKAHLKIKRKAQPCPLRAA